jgi:Siphovirus Gp157
MSQQPMTSPSSVPAPRRSLYDISVAIVGLHEQREQAEYEGDAARVTEIDGQLKQYLSNELPAKIDSVRNYIRWQENEAKVRAEEAKNQAVLAGRAQDNVARMKDLLLWCLQQLGQTKLEGALHWVRRQGNGGLKPLNIRQPELVPENFKVVTVELRMTEWGKVLDQVRVLKVSPPEPHSGLIRAALERGEGVPGCELGDRGEHVRTS